MKVVILAAGRGKRMGDWTDSKQKAMLPIKSTIKMLGKEYVVEKPMLEITIEQFSAAGFNEFVIVVGYRKQDIINHFGDGSQFGVDIKYVTQKNVCAGTADAVACSNFFLDGHFGVDKFTPFFLIYADVVPTITDINGVFAKYMETPEEVCGGVMGVRTVNDPQRYGVVELDGNDNIVRIVEKSPNPPTNLINAGIYILPVEIFKQIKKTKLSERGEFEFTESIQLFIEDGNEMKIMEVSGLKDIGTKQIYENTLISADC